MLIWFVFYLFVLIVPLTAYFCGMWFLKNPPQKINSLSGYRTSRSMKSKAAWDFAQEKCGMVWKRLGKILVPVSTVVYLPALGRDLTTCEIWCLIVILLQTAALIATIIPVERALKRSFDPYGRRIIQ